MKKIFPIYCLLLILSFSSCQSFNYEADTIENKEMLLGKWTVTRSVSPDGAPEDFPISYEFLQSDRVIIQYPLYEDIPDYSIDGVKLKMRHYYDILDLNSTEMILLRQDNDYYENYEITLFLEKVE